MNTPDQIIFTTARDHLLAQNRKSVAKCGTPMYRNTDGCCCSIGIFIPDSDYHTGLEGLYVTDWVRTCRYIPQDLEEVNIALISELQYCHDEYPVFQWKERLKEIALEFDLEWE